VYTVKPCFAVPLPGGSSVPSAETAGTVALICSSLAAVPSRYVGPCANAAVEAHSPIAAASSLEERILNAAVTVHLPRLNAIEVIRLQEVLGRHAQILRRFGNGRLDLAAFIRAPRLQHRLVAIPLPGTSKSRVREAEYRLLKLRLLVRPATVY
jgi:hypothetical protein